MDIDTVQQRTGEPRLIIASASGRAAAGLCRIGEIAAAAWWRCLPTPVICTALLRVAAAQVVAGPAANLGPAPLEAPPFRRFATAGGSRSLIGKSLDLPSVGKGQSPANYQHYPRIFDFLGYRPFCAAVTLPEQLIAKRRELGLSIKKAAKLIGVDEGTFARWESGTGTPLQHGTLVAQFLASEVLSRKLS